MKKTGRPSKLNEELLKDMKGLFERGGFRNEVCGAVGISYVTFLNWMERGRKAKTGQFLEFFDTIKKAEAVGKLSHIVNITRHSEQSWQASAWFLERRYPEEFRKVDRIESTGINGQPQQVEHVITWKTKPVINSEALSPRMNGGSRTNSNGPSSTVKLSEK